MTIMKQQKNLNRQNQQQYYYQQQNEEEEQVSQQVEMIMSMYSDECTLVANSAGHHVIIIHLPIQLELRMQITANSGYPRNAYPFWHIDHGACQQIILSFRQQFDKRIKEQVQFGFPMLVQLISLAQQIANNMNNVCNCYQHNQQQQQRQQQHKKKQQQQQQQQSQTLCNDFANKHTSKNVHQQEATTNNMIEVWVGEPMVDRKSKFLAHMAHITSEQDVHKVVDTLRHDKHLSTAHHPAMFAYRFVDAKGVVHLDGDDDGQSGASAKIMFLLDQHKVDGYVIIVTRWFGGILLYQDRFRHIMEVTKNMILTIPQHDNNKPQKH